VIREILIEIGETLRIIGAVIGKEETGDIVGIGETTVAEATIMIGEGSPELNFRHTIDPCIRKEILINFRTADLTEMI